MRKKEKLSKKLMDCKVWWRTHDISEKLKEIESELNSEYTKRMLLLEGEAINKMKKEPQYFYKYAKKFSKSFSQVGNFLTEDGDIVQNSVEKANMLRKQYESVYSTPDERYIIQDPDIFFNVQQYVPDTCDACVQNRGG